MAIFNDGDMSSITLMRRAQRQAQQLSIYDEAKFICCACLMLLWSACLVHVSNIICMGFY